MSSTGKEKMAERQAITQRIILASHFSNTSRGAKSQVSKDYRPHDEINGHTILCLYFFLEVITFRKQLNQMETESEYFKLRGYPI